MNTVTDFLVRLKTFLVGLFHSAEVAEAKALANLPKVESILADVTSFVQKLEASAESHAKAAVKHAADVVAAEAKKLESEAQTALANTVAANIKALLTPKV